MWSMLVGVADTTARTLRLLSLLQTHRSWPGNELASRLGVSARTLRRDVDRLRELGYEVEATPGAAGGYRLANGSHLPPLLLDDDEAVAIAVGLRAAAGAALAGIEETSVRAMAKLERVLPDRLRRRVGALHANVAVLRWGGSETPTVEPETLATLAQACRDHEEARFAYTAKEGERTDRLVQPHRLVAVGRRWYLVAWDCRRDDWRTFRLDRIADARLAGARFAPREVPGGDPAEFVARSLRSGVQAHRAVVVVHGPPAALADVARWMGTEATDAGDGRTRLELRSDTAGWLAALVADLAVRFDVEVESSDDGLAELLASTGRRLVAAAGCDGRGCEEKPVAEDGN